MTGLCLAEMLRAPRTVREQHAVARSLVLIAIALAGCALSLEGAPTARAQDGAQEVPGYRAIVEEALTEYTAQNYLEAMTLFVRAHELWPNARTLRGLGVVSFELHRYSDSVSFLQQALAAAEKRLDGTMRSDTERLLARARGFVAKIDVSSVPVDAQVRVDGEPSPRTVSGALLLDVGKHQLEFSAPGYDPKHLSYTVVGGEELLWKVSLRRTGTRLESPSGWPAVPLLGWHKALGATAIGLGVAGLVSASIFTAKRRAEGDRYRSVAPEDAEYRKALRAWEDTRSRPYILAGVGASALASGATGLLLRTPNRRLAIVGASVAAAAGAGLAVWGTAEVLQGSACDLPIKCSESLERRDRGVVTLLSAFPLVVTPLTLLLRHWLRTQPVAAVALSSGVNPRQRSLSLDLRASW
ncbi:MAG: hypothetical protein RLZZ450_2505 [Pseudomonadota bacterium]